MMNISVIWVLSILTTKILENSRYKKEMKVIAVDVKSLTAITFTSCYEMITRTVCEKYQLTQMEYDILMFLHSNPKHNTAADIVKVRKSTKSHVSTSLKELENRGLIKKVQSAENKKHIEIVLLEEAEPIIEAGIETQKKFAQNVLKGLTEEEKHICITVFNKICSNADEYMKNNVE